MEIVTVALILIAIALGVANLVLLLSILNKGPELIDKAKGDMIEKLKKAVASL